MANDVKVYEKDLTEFHEDPANPNKGSQRGRALLDTSVKELGAARSMVADKDGNIVAGNKTREALLRQGVTKAIVVETDGKTPVIVKRTDWDLDEKQGAARQYAFADNRVGELSLSWDEAQVIEAVNAGLDLTSMFDTKELDDLIKVASGTKVWGEGVTATEAVSLVDRFVVPPFTTLDSRQGYWQERKRAWKAIHEAIGTTAGRHGPGATPITMDMKSGVRAKNPVAVHSVDQEGFFGDRVRYTTPDETSSGASIFDPVMCELAYRWFCLPGGEVFDPFAGGSVRGLVASLLGYKYVGIDLRPEQVAINRTQWEELVARSSGVDPLNDPALADPTPVTDPTAMTPVQRRGEFWIKRDDAFSVGTAGNGGKVRSCWTLAQAAQHGLVTAGSRQSPQVNIVAGVAAALGLPCRVHTPKGKIGPEVQAAVDNGAELVQHGAGYNNVIVARAHEDAEARGWTEIPFGMECQEAVDATRAQVANLPADAKRLVVPVGSGMSLAGILHGLADVGNPIPVVGVVVGADPSKRLAKYAPAGWRERVTLVKSTVDYHDNAPETTLEGVRLDPVYEAKCLPFLQPGDCLWVVGRRASAAPQKKLAAPGPEPEWVLGDSLNQSALLGDRQVDMIFSCPPYYDLETYSDDPADLSNLDSYDDFLKSYREIIRQAVARLRDNRFACFVVGDIRDKRGAYRNFVSHTIQAFEDAGMVLYNEAILLTSIGTASLRVGNQFAGMRKLVKCHQNVLVFWKGDPRLVKDAIPPVDASFPTDVDQSSPAAASDA